MSFAQDRHDQPQVVVVRSGHPGLIAGLLGCVLGLFGIFSIGIIFVPLAAICSLIGLLRGLGAGNGPGIGTSVLGFALTIAGFCVSPSLLLLTGLSIVASQLGQPSTPRPAAVVYQPPVTRMAPATVMQPGVQVPQFRDYPAEPYSGPSAPVILATPDEVNFRTRLREAVRQPANFAGSYSLALWGCGTSCVTGAAVNLKTGHVVWLPSSICCWPMDVDSKFQPVVAHLNSTLIVLSGLRNEKEGDQGAHFYSLEGERFGHILDVPRP